MTASQPHLKPRVPGTGMNVINRKSGSLADELVDLMSAESGDSIYDVNDSVDTDHYMRHLHGKSANYNLMHGSVQMNQQ